MTSSRDALTQLRCIARKCESSASEPRVTEPPDTQGKPHHPMCYRNRFWRVDVHLVGVDVCLDHACLHPYADVGVDEMRTSTTHMALIR
mmetsp:Transcript_19726/g.47827  ORF Transcript_19726/g.47827 Transcript_19726/m.47827 type:complete len:89 (+) Transcript_19726:1001-1267(+)